MEIENYKFSFRIVYFNLLLIIDTLMSEIHMLNFVNDSKGSIHLNEIKTKKSGYDFFCDKSTYNIVFV